MKRVGKRILAAMLALALLAAAPMELLAKEEAASGSGGGMTPEEEVSVGEVKEELSVSPTEVKEELTVSPAEAKEELTVSPAEAGEESGLSEDSEAPGLSKDSEAAEAAEMDALRDGADASRDFSNSTSSNYIEVTPNFDWPLLYREDGEGNPVEQDLLDVSVRFNGTLLKKGVDYTVDYDRDRWKAAAKEAVGPNGLPVGSKTETLDYPVKINGIGAYTGQWNVTSGSGDLYGHATEVQYRIMPHVEETVGGEVTTPQGVSWSWSLDPEGLLRINGEGEMPEGLSSNYWIGGSDPDHYYLYGWRHEHSMMIRRAVITGGVTVLEENVFSDCENLAEVILPDSVQHIGNGAFYNLHCLQSIHAPDSERMPADLRSIGDKALGINTYNLTVHLGDLVESVFPTSNATEYNRVYCRLGTTTEKTLRELYSQTFLVEGYDGYWVKGGDNYNLGGTYTVYKYKGPGGEMTLPDFIDSITVYDMFTTAASRVTSLTIPGNIRVLNRDAFRSLSNCGRIVIEPGELSELPSGLLNGNESPAVLLSVPDTVTILPENGFSDFYNSLTMIVGKDSAAHKWALAQGYTEEGGEGKLHYRLRAVTQPYVLPAAPSMDTTGIKDLTLAKNDGSFAFDSLSLGGNVLVQGRDYTVQGGKAVLKKAFLKTLEPGTYPFTFHYAQGENSEAPKDPVVTLNLIRGITASLRVLDQNGREVTDRCDIRWTVKGVVRRSPVALTNEPMAVSFSVEPGNGLKQPDGEQYYQGITGETETKEEGNVTTVTLPRLGKAALSVSSGESEVPKDSTAGYDVIWYSKDPEVYGNASPDGEGYGRIGTGAVSPKVPEGSILYYDVKMTGKNAEDYRDIVKGSVAISFGRLDLIADATKGAKIILNITGAKHSGEALTPADYRISWYRKNAQGEFEALSRKGNLLSERDVTKGETCWYEIMPADHDGAHNWLDFYGVPLREAKGEDPGTAVVIGEEGRVIDVSLGLVQKSVLSGRIENSPAVFSAAGSRDTIRLSLTQEPWGGYTGRNQAVYDRRFYEKLWDQPEFDLWQEEGVLCFETEVYNLDALVTAEDTSGNFRRTYKSILQEKLAEEAVITMAPDTIPLEMPFTLSRTYPKDNEAGFVTDAGGTRSEAFRWLSFTLKNKTTGETLDPEKYELYGDCLHWKDKDYAEKHVKIGNELELTMAYPEGEEYPGAVVGTGTDTLIVRQRRGDYKKPEYSFELSLIECGKLQFTTETAQKEPYLTEAWAIYDAAGHLVESHSKRAKDTALSQGLPKGDYTLVVWRKSTWYAAAATLDEVHAALNTGYYQEMPFSIENGKLSRLSLGHTPILYGESLFFGENLGFGDETVEAGLDEWKLFTLNYSVDPRVRKENPEAVYQITVNKAGGGTGTEESAYVNLKCREDFANNVFAPDPNISLYVNGVLKESLVSIDSWGTSDIRPVYGFTLETAEPEGKICFYLKSALPGSHPITAKGGIKGSAGATGILGDTNLVIREASGVCLASDYLREGQNAAWIYTVPGRYTSLYLDGVKIADRKRNDSNGGVFFTFTIDDAFKQKFAGQEGWTLPGLHECYSVTELADGGELRSAPVTLRYLDGKSYSPEVTPALLTKLWVKSYSDYEGDERSTRAYTVYSLEHQGLYSFYRGPDERGTYYSCDFTASFENADALEQDTVYLWIVGQNGTEYYVPMTRKAGTNDFVGSVKDKKLLFTSWGIHFRSAVDETKQVLHPAQEDMTKSQIVVSDAGMTAEQYYNRLVSAETDPTDPEKGCLGTMTEEELNELLTLSCDTLDDFFGGLGVLPEGMKLDGSKESLEELNTLMGITEGTALGDGKLFDYESWPEAEVIKAAEGGIETRAYAEAVSDGEDLYLNRYFVKLPSGDHPEGYERLQVIRIEAKDLTPEEQEYLPRLSADGHTFDRYQQYSSTVLKELKSFNNSLRDAVKRLTGNDPRTAYQLNFLLSHLKEDQKITGSSTTSQESTGLSELLENIKVLKALAKQGKFGAVSGQYEKRFEGYENDLRSAIGWRDRGVGAKVFQDVTNLYQQITDVKQILSVKGLKDAMEYLAGSSLAAKITLYTGYSIYEKKWSAGLTAAALEMLLDLTGKALLHKASLSEQEVARIMKELYEDLRIRNLIREQKPENPELKDLPKPSDISSETKGGAGGGTGSGSGGHAAALHDPQGIVYEAVLSNPVQNATAALHQAVEKNGSGEVVSETLWPAQEYGQINPQLTGADGQYQWDVPEGEYKVYVSAPEGSDYADNTSEDHPAANLADGSAAGWLPVMPVQLGINIPLFSNRTPEVKAVHFYPDRAVADFSLYMDVSTLSEDVVKLFSGDVPVPCAITFPDEEESPLGDSRVFARTMELKPGEGFAEGKSYTLRIGKEAEAYTHKPLSADYDSGALAVEKEVRSVTVSEATGEGSAEIPGEVLQLGLGEEKTVIVSVKDELEEPVSGAVVYALSSAEGVVSVEASAVTSKSGTAMFTLKSLTAGYTDLTFKPEHSGLSAPLYVNSGRIYRYQGHEVSWGAYDLEKREVKASFLVSYEVTEGDRVFTEQLSSGLIPATMIVRTGEETALFSCGYLTRDPEQAMLTDMRIINLETGDFESDDYSYEGKPDGSYDAFFAEEAVGTVGLTYTGAKLTPEVLVADGKKLLILGTDYTLSYRNNTNAGEAKAIVKLKGKTKWQKELKFKINPADLGSEEVLVGNTVVVSGKKAAPTLVYKGLVLKAKTDYTGVPAEKITADTAITVTAGTRGNFTGKKTFTLKAVPNGKAVGSLTVKLKASLIYNGKPQTLNVAGPMDTMNSQLTVTDKKTKEVLQEGVDFAVSVSESINAGTVKLVVVGLGTRKGTVKKSVKLSPAVWTKKKSAGVKEFRVANAAKLAKGFTETGAAITPFVDIQAVLSDGREVTLIPGRDYQLSYSKNRKAGEAKAKVSFKGNFKGSAMDPVAFTILKKE